MKLLLPLFFFIVSSSQVFGVVKHRVADPQVCELVTAVEPEFMDMNMDEFLELSPRAYRKKTGKRLGLMKSIKLKMAQKMIKRQQRRNNSSLSSGLYLIMAIFTLGWLAIGLLGDWSGFDWIINLGLAALCWLTGFGLISILVWVACLGHAMIRKNDYL